MELATWTLLDHHATFWTRLWVISLNTGSNLILILWSSPSLLTWASSTKSHTFVTAYVSHKHKCPTTLNSSVSLNRKKTPPKSILSILLYKVSGWVWCHELSDTNSVVNITKQSNKIIKKHIEIWLYISYSIF